MKTSNIIVIPITFVLLLSQLMAQTPQGIPYQAVARDNQTLLTNQNLDVRFSIFEGGTIVYQERQNVQTNDYGLFSLVIGKGQTIGSNSFSDIKWGNQAHFLKVELKNQDSVFVNMGTTALESVPYSLHSAEADRLSGGLDDISDVIAPAPAIGDVLVWDGNMWVASGDVGGTSVAGPGIGIINDSIYNTGDLNALDDILIGSQATGDLDEFYPSPKVIKIRGRDIADIAPQVGQVLKWTGLEWRPAADDGGNGGGINAIAPLIGDGSLGNQLRLPDQNVGIGQILKFTGFQWEARNDSINTQQLSIAGTVLSLSNGGGSVNLPFVSYIPGQGIGIVGSVISNLGDTNPNDDITRSTTANGDLSGTFPTLQVERIKGNIISSDLPSDGNILKFQGGIWEPQVDEVNDADADPNNEIQTLTKSGNDLILSNGGGVLTLQSYLAGPGITLSATGNPNLTRIVNSGDPNEQDDITINDFAQGDIGGTFLTTRLNSIQGNVLSAANPSDGDVLLYSGGQWLPSSNSDGDSDPSNELQFLSIVGNQLFLSNGGGNITLPDPPNYTGGIGISVNGTIITNTGDQDASDDITENTPAAGDLSGFYPNPIVEQIQGTKVSDVDPSNDEILIFNGNIWAPSSNYDTDPNNEFQNLSLSGNALSLGPNGNTVNLPEYTAGNGIDIVNNVVINTGDLIESDDLKITSSAQGDVTGTFSSLKVTAIQGAQVTSSLPTTAGQILKWDQNQTQWVLGFDEGEVYSAGNGINILPGNIIENAGDPLASDDVLKTDIAMGDVSGTFGNLSVTALQGSEVSPVPPTTIGQVLKWDGTQWEAGNDQGTVYTAGAGINITASNILQNTGDTNASDDVLKSDFAGGDISGNFDNMTVTHLNGSELANTPPQLGEVLKWNGLQWEAQADSVADGDSDAGNEIQTLSLSGTTISLSNGGSSIQLPYTAGNGINIVGTQIINTGDTNPNNDVNNNDPFGGDVSGVYDNLTVTHIQNSEVSAGAPSNGQILKWNAANDMWMPAVDDTISITAGTGIGITNNQIRLINTSVTPGTYGSANTVAAFTVDTKGRLTGVNEIPITDENTTYTAGNGLDLLGTTFQLDNTGVSAGAYGSSTFIPSITVDAQGRISSISEIAFSPNGTPYTAGVGLALDTTTFRLDATGVTEGTYGSTTQVPILEVDSLGRIQSIDTITISSGGPTYTAGTGIEINGSDEISTTALLPSDNAGGDINGNFDSLTLAKIQGIDIAAASPNEGEILFYNGTNWLSDTLESINIKITTDVLPDVDDTYNLGNDSTRFNTVYATVGTINTSDIREKKDIEELEYGLKEIMKLRPVSFDWKNEDLGERKLGLIAQEVLPVINEVVKTHDTSIDPKTGEKQLQELSRYGVFYSDLIPVLIKGMQEQQGQLEEQESLLEAQKNRLDEQEKLILGLMKRLEKLEGK